MKEKVMLITPTLQQGGLQRVCVRTAHLLAPYADVTVVVFNGADIAYDVSGLKIVDIGMGVKRGKMAKLFNIIRRAIRLRRLKRELQTAIAYSFGATANLANAFSKTAKTKVWLGLRSYMDMGEHMKLRLFVRRCDRMICCSRRIERELRDKYNCDKTVTLYNPFDVERMLREASSQEPIL
ncbi:MAG: glycosyltransferase, partial [Lachnospiraceae bacterium]|nr:glycosyltransferase [Lachnospiraceae bacterium]